MGYENAVNNHLWIVHDEGSLFAEGDRTFVLHCTYLLPHPPYPRDGPHLSSLESLGPTSIVVTPYSLTSCMGLSNTHWHTHKSWKGVLFSCYSNFENLINIHLSWITLVVESSNPTLYHQTASLSSWYALILYCTHMSIRLIFCTVRECIVLIIRMCHVYSW